MSGGPPLTPEQRRRRDSARGRIAQDGLLARFERQVDPDGILDPDERVRRAEEARAAHFREIGRRGGKARVVAARARPPAAAAPAPAGAAPAPAETAPVPVTEGGGRAARELTPADWAHLWQQPDVRVVLSDRDVGAAYRALRDFGVSQRRIAALTGQSQSEVSDVINDRRQVRDVEVLERICLGVGIPLPAVRLLDKSPDEDAAYSDKVTVADPAEGDEMLRRHFQHLLALAATATFGASVKGVGELADWLAAPPVPGEARIGMTDVEMIRQCGEVVGNLARTCGGQGQAAVRLAGWADQWLDSACAEEVRRTLLSTLAHIHTVTAWCCHDSGAVARSHYEFGRAIELATKGGDAYGAAYAMRHAGMMLVDRGEPDRALKMVQLGGLRLDGVSAGDPRVAVQRAECRAISALALAQLHQRSPDGSLRRRALEDLAATRDGWDPPSAHARGCMDLDTAHAHLYLGQFDVAEALAATSARILAHSGDRREGVLADMALARLHVQAGEPRGLQLARSAIESVAQIDSAVARQIWLPPLIEALEARPESDAKDLARAAQQIAA